MRKVIYFPKYRDVNVCKIIHTGDLKDVVETGTGTKKCCETYVIYDKSSDKDKRKRTKKIFIDSTDK